MSKAVISTDIDIIEQAFGENSPFNLRRDAKNHDLSGEDLEKLAENIADELLEKGFNNTSRVPLFWGYKRKATYAKIKIAKVSGNFGKSKGYRVIILWDDVIKEGYLLHIFDHNEKDNLKPQEKSKLAYIVSEYIKYKYEEL